MAEDNPAGRAILAAARKHVANSTFLHIDVPEWPDAEGKPARIWYRPTITVNESFDIARWKVETGDGRYQQAYIVIRRALDEKGNQLFNIGDESMLLETDWLVLQRIADVLTKRPKVDDAKNG